MSKNIKISRVSKIKISKKNKKKYIVLDNSKDSEEIENTIFKKTLSKIKK